MLESFQNKMLSATNVAGGCLWLYWFWTLSEISANRSAFGVDQRERDRDAAEPDGGGGAAGGGGAGRAEEEGGGVRAGDPAAPPAADVQTEVCFWRWWRPKWSQKRREFKTQLDNNHCLWRAK